MNKPELFKELENRTININGHNIEVKLRVFTMYDEGYDSSLDDEATLEKLDRGDYQPYGVIVTASALGEEGTGSIWGVLVGSQDDVQSCLDFYGPDLIDEALNELKDLIEKQIEKFSAYSEVSREN